VTDVPTFVGAAGVTYWGIEGRAGRCFQLALSKVFEVLGVGDPFSLDGHLDLVFGETSDGVRHSWVEFDTYRGERRVFDLTLGDEAFAAEAYYDAFRYRPVRLIPVGDIDPRQIWSMWEAFNGLEEKDKQAVIA
jgi:hypothetical protein